MNYIGLIKDQKPGLYIHKDCYPSCFLVVEGDVGLSKNRVLYLLYGRLFDHDDYQKYKADYWLGEYLGEIVGVKTKKAKIDDIISDCI